MTDSPKWIFSWSELGEDDVYFDAESDPELRPLVKSAGSTIDISKLTQGVAHAGSGTLEEMYELMGLMRTLISTRKYKYSELESYLVTIGYNLKLIRRMFKRLTGMRPEEVMNEDYLYTPAPIPQMNCGWGEASGKKDAWYFIMPWNSTYAIFAQVGDLDRQIVDTYVTLELALMNLKSLVKEVYTAEKPIELIKRDNNELRGPEVLPAGFGIKMSKDDDDGKTDDGKDAKKESDPVSDEMDKAEFFDSKAPSELLDSSLSEKFPVVEIIDEIMKHMDETQKDIEPYRLELGGVQFVVNEKLKYEQTPKMDNVQVATPSFASQAVISLMFTVIREEQRKRGLSVFLFTQDGELLNNGTFKGIDSKLYALSREGLDSYFGV
jgi:hypothetical protein